MAVKLLWLGVLAAAVAKDATLSMKRSDGSSTSLTFDGTVLDLGNAPVSLGDISNLEEAISANAGCVKPGDCATANDCAKPGECATAGDLSDVELAVSAVKGDVQSIQAQVASSHQKLTALETKITEVHSMVSTLNKTAEQNNEYGSKANPAKNCLDIYENEAQKNGLYWIDCDGNCEVMQVFCSMEEGGGWTLVVKIDGSNQRHYNTGAVGANVVKRSSSGAAKYSDVIINAIQNAYKGTTEANIRFECGSNPRHFFRGCEFHATQALGNSDGSHTVGNAPLACIHSYETFAAKDFRNTIVCNKGSRGLGSHCTSSQSAAYCRHCNDAPGVSLGCSHDDGIGNHNDGFVYVRGMPTITGLTSSNPASSCMELYNEGRPSGQYFVDGPSGAVRVHCEMTNGGGWTLVVKISGANQNHYNTAAVGDKVVTPSSSAAKYSDSLINFLRSNSQSPSGQADIRFDCGSNPSHYYKDCPFQATRQLGTPSHRIGGHDMDCVRSYTSPSASSILNNIVCNHGSRGLGSHCSSSNTAAYCRHCNDCHMCSRGCSHDGGIGNHNNGAVYVR